jgi:alkylation response protein AidB-like acyl-CoA dehydrogenase
MVTLGVAMSSTEIDAIVERVAAIAADWAGERAERQRRRTLDLADFDRVRDAGYLRASLPVDEGGLWKSFPRSSGLTFDLLRMLAHGDSSVALVAAMHPLVLASGGWPGSPPAPAPYTEAWSEQCRWVFQSVRDGAWWGTSMSEPGTGGDVGQSRSTARRDPAHDDPLAYRATGQKHFGSGSGIMDYMITSAVPEGEDAVEIFYVNMREAAWDGSTGVQVTAPWDGHGMTATQSHALEFVDCPATRLAWPNPGRARGLPARAYGGGFVAVVIGIVEVAVETARAQRARRAAPLASYEEVEWSRVEIDAWLIQQAYEGILRAAESDQGASRAGLVGKTAIAELAESVLTRICRVVGGGAFSRSTPYGFWLEDVRALGFLRPPWSLAFDRINAGSWPAP